MFLEPVANTADSLENYTDSTSAWTRSNGRMVCANGTFVSNWIEFTPVGIDLADNPTAEILTAVVNSASCNIVLRGDLATNRGYLIATGNADGTHLKITISRLDNSTTLTLLASSAAFTTAPTWVGNNWKEYWIEASITSGGVITANARYYDDPDTVQATVTFTDHTYTDGGVYVACPTSSLFFSNAAVYDSATETLDKSPDTLVAPEGDSRPSGVILGGTWLSWPVKLRATLGRKFLVITSLPVSGSTFTDLIARGAALDALYDKDRYDRCIVPVQCGTNGLLANGAGVTEQANRETYSAARRANGERTLFFAETDRTSGTTADWATNLAYFNVTGRETWPNYSDRYINILTVPALTDTTNTTYFSDGLHETIAAVELEVPKVAAQIQDIRNADLEANAGFGFTTIVFTFKKNGAAEPLTSAYLSDRDGVFGVKRLDTGEVVIPAGRPLTQTTIDGVAVDGSYYVTFPNPAEGLTYLAVERAVYNGDTFFLPKMAIMDAANGSSSPSNILTTIVQGDDYADGTASPSLAYVIDNYAGPTIGGANVRWRAIANAQYEKHGASSAEITITEGTVSQSGSTVTIKVPMTSAQSASFRHTSPPDKDPNYKIIVQVIGGNGAVMTQVIGDGVVLKRIV